MKRTCHAFYALFQTLLVEIFASDALWIKYVFLNQAKRLWHFYAEVRACIFFFVVILHFIPRLFF